MTNFFGDCGMNIPTVFIRESLPEGHIPFEPNKKTIAAMLEAERIAKDPRVKGYNDLDELFLNLKS